MHGKQASFLVTPSEITCIYFCLFSRIEIALYKGFEFPPCFIKRDHRCTWISIFTFILVQIH